MSKSRRTLDQRLALRFPRLNAAYARLIGGLPPTSRLRQAVYRLVVRLGSQAFNRGDLDVVLLVYHPNFEFHPPRGMVEAGLAELCYRGWAGYREFLSTWAEV